MNALFIGGLGVPELLIILAVLLLLFGGSRLAGLGKSTGRALKEFKEETKGLKGADAAGTTPPPTTGSDPNTSWDSPAPGAAGSSIASSPPPVTNQDVPSTDVRRDV